MGQHPSLAVSIGGIIGAFSGFLLGFNLGLSWGLKQSDHSLARSNAGVIAMVTAVGGASFFGLIGVVVGVFLS